jgi:hypothetical protein
VTLVTAIEAKDESELTAEKILHEERKQLAKMSSKNGAAYGASASGIKCFNCGDIGHKSNSCPKKKKGSNNDQKKDKPKFKGKCNHCGKTGDKEHDCWAKQKGQANTAEDTGTDESEEGCAVEVCEEEVNLMHVGNESWLLDSRASVHICKDRRMFDNYKQVYGIRIKTADGRSKPLLAEGSGTVRIKQGGQNVRLDDCLYVPSASQNLISVCRVAKAGHTVTFTKEGCTINFKSGKEIHLEQSGSLVLTANESVLEKKEEEIHATTICRWHERLGHVNIQTLSQMRKEGIVDGLDFAGDSIEGEEEICVPCLEGKQTEKKLGKGGQLKTTEVLELLITVHIGDRDRE